MIRHPCFHRWGDVQLLMDIPRYDEVGLDIIHNLIRTAGITREAFLSLLENC